jgi:hypothetical protein
MLIFAPAQTVAAVKSASGARSANICSAKALIVTLVKMHNLGIRIKIKQSSG